MPKNFSIFFGFKSFKYYFTVIPCAIFDGQPLLIKGIAIIKSKSAYQLGRFYTMISFVDSNGSIMKGSVTKLGTKLI